MVKKIIISLNLIFAMGFAYGMEQADVVLQLGDGTTVTLENRKAEQCKVIKNMLDALNSDSSALALGVEIKNVETFDCINQLLGIVCDTLPDIQENTGIAEELREEILRSLCEKIDSFKQNKKLYINLINGLNYLDCHEYIVEAAIFSFAQWCVKQDKIINCSKLPAEMKVEVGRKMIESMHLRELFAVPRLIIEKKYEGMVKVGFDIEPLTVNNIIFSQSGSIAIQRNDGFIELYNTINGNCIATKKGCLAFVPGGFCAALHSELTTNIFDLKSGQSVSSICWDLDESRYSNSTCLRNIRTFNYSPDGKFAAFYLGSEIRIINLENNTIVKKINNVTPQGQFCFSPDSSFFVCSNLTVNIDDSYQVNKPVISVYSTQDFSQSFEFAIPSRELSMINVSPNCRYIVACCPIEGLVIIRDLHEKTKECNLYLFDEDKYGKDVMTLLFSSDENICAVSSSHKSYILDLKNKKEKITHASRRKPELICSIINDEHYITKIYNGFNIRNFSDGTIHKKFISEDLKDHGMNSHIVFQRNSPEGNFFAQVIHHEQSSWWRKNESYDHVYIWQCSNLDLFKDLTIEQLLLLREITKKNSPTIYTCGNSEEHCAHHKDSKESLAYWSMPDRLQKQLLNFIKMIPCAYQEQDGSEQLMPKPKFNTFSNQFLNKNRLYQLFGSLTGMVTGAALGYSLANKCNISDKAPLYSTMALMGTVGALTGGYLFDRFFKNSGG